MPREPYRVTYREDASPKDFRMRTPQSPALRHFRADDADPSSKTSRTKDLMLDEHEVANLRRDRRFVVEDPSDKTDDDADAESEAADESAPPAKETSKKRAAKKAAAQ